MFYVIFYKFNSKVCKITCKKIIKAAQKIVYHKFINKITFLINFNAYKIILKKFRIKKIDY